jgi:inner membrane protein
VDNLTHSLVGALLGQAGLKRRTGLAMPALVIGANLPDIDASCIVYGVESLAMRRGITHGPIAWVVLPLALAGLLWWLDRWQARRGKRPEGRAEVSFVWLFALGFVACLTHPALDWLNNYGIRLLEPFSSRWYYGDTLFIADVWLWLGLGLATWLSLERERRGGDWTAPARAMLILALVYVAGNLAWTRILENQAALDAEMKGFAPGEATVIASPVPLRPWKRDVFFGANGKWFRKEWLGRDVVFHAPLSSQACKFPDLQSDLARRPDLAAFLFWSRAPYVERAEGGDGIVLRDARFARLGGDRFSVHLPGILCRTEIS